MEGRDGKRFVGADQFSMDADDDVAFQFNDTATTLKGNKDTNSNETGMKSDGHDSETSRTRDLCYSFQTFALDCNNGRTDGRRGPGGGEGESRRRFLPRQLNRPVGGPLLIRKQTKLFAVDKEEIWSPGPILRPAQRPGFEDVAAGRVVPPWYTYR